MLFFITIDFVRHNRKFSKSNALDVDSEDDFKDLVKKVRDEELTKVNILVDMQNVSTKCKAKVRLTHMSESR